MSFSNTRHQHYIKLSLQAIRDSEGNDAAWEELQAKNLAGQMPEFHAWLISELKLTPPEAKEPEEVEPPKEPESPKPQKASKTKK